MSSTPVKFGLIGFGAWGKHHANAIDKCTNADVAAIVAPSEGTRKEAHSLFPDAKLYDNYQELVADANVDCVDIVVPSHLHHEIASAALRAGLHVLLEKPMAVSIAQCNDLLRIADEENRLLAVGHELRLSSMWGLVKRMIDDGFIGDPLYALVELSRNPYRQGSNGWRYDISRVGNWILEEPIHFFDLARWYLSASGNPKSVFATANSSQKDHPELQDNFSALMQFDEGAYAVVTQTLCAFEHHQTIKVTGTQGALWASWSGAIDRTRHPTFSLRAFDGSKVKTMPIEKMTGELFELEDQVEVFANAVRNQAPLHCTGSDGRWSVAMCLAAQASVDRGCSVDLGEFIG